MENGENEGTTKITAPSPIKRSVYQKNVLLCAVTKTLFPVGKVKNLFTLTVDTFDQNGL